MEAAFCFLLFLGKTPSLRALASGKGKGFSVGDTVSCVVSNNGTSKAADDYIKSAVVSEVDCLPAEIEVGSEGALVHYASETYYLERK